LIKSMISQPDRYPSETLKKAFQRTASMRAIDAQVSALEQQIAQRSQAKTFLDSLPIG